MQVSAVPAPIPTSCRAVPFVAARLKAVGRVLAVVLFGAFLVLMGQQLFGTGRPVPDVAGDFLSFWIASDMARQGAAAEVYQLATFRAAQLAFHGDPSRAPVSFYYPPIYLLACLPLTLIPYAMSAALWLGTTAAAYVSAVRTLLPRLGLVIPFLAYPPVFVNAAYGQNGFLSAALFAWAASNLGRRPALAGLCFGCLAYKPHIGLAVPIALAAVGRWRAFAAAAGTVIALFAVSLAAFGTEPWAALLAHSAQARSCLEGDSTCRLDPSRMASVFGSVRLLGGPVAAAYGAQAVSALAAVAFLVWALRRYRHAGAEAETAALVACVPLCSPYLFEYDLVILAVPMAYLVGRAAQVGFLPFERTVVTVLFVAPIAVSVIAWRYGVPLAPLLAAALFATVLRRAAADFTGKAS